MKIRHKRSLLLTLFYFHILFCYSQSENSLIIMDPTKLTNVEKIAFYQACLKMYSSINEGNVVVDFNPFYSTVEYNRSMKYSLKQAYNVKPNNAKALYEFLKDSVTKITSAITLTSSHGETIFSDYLPILHKNPNSSALNNIQLIDIVDKTASYKNLENFFNSTDSLANFLKVDKQTNLFSLSDNNFNGYWGLRLPDSLASRFFNSLKSFNADILDKMIYFSEGMPMADLFEPTINSETGTATVEQVGNTMILTEPFVSELQKLTANDFNYLYVIDIFDSKRNCQHGDKVLDVISEVLQRMFMDKELVTLLKSKIVKLPINYFENRQVVNQLLHTLLAKINGGNEAQYKNSLKGNKSALFDYEQMAMPIRQLQTLASPPEKNKMPSFLLNAFLKYCTLNDKKADIITSSIILKMPFARIGLKLPNIEALLFTAADNQLKAIEDLYEIENGISNTEPLMSYYESKDKTGCFIIGGSNVGNRPFGMYSKDGSGITGIGHIRNWKGSGDTVCISPGEQGNSFATPEIATCLWVAGAFWRKANLIVNPLDAKFKYLLSCDLEAELVGRFGSGGIININQLLFPAFKYLVKDAGVIEPVSLSDSSYIKIGNSEIRFGRSNFNENSPVPIIGLTSIANRLFVLRANQIAWKEFPPTALMQVFLKLSNGEIFTSLESFFTRYKKIVHY